MPNIIAQGSREDAIEALMNVWLKMPQRWCLNCEMEFDPIVTRFGCCDAPYMTTNALVFQHFKNEMQMIREEQKNDYASTGDKNTNMRYLLRFPPGLVQFLEVTMQRLYKEKLFTKEHDQIWFAKKFGKHFCVAKII